MKTQPKHTPTPWKVGSLKSLKIEVNTDDVLEIEGKSREPIGLINRLNDNAAYIVRAVNSHESMLGALKLAERELTDFCDTPDKEGFVLAPDSIARISLNRVREAITKAEHSDTKGGTPVSRMGA